MRKPIGALLLVQYHHYQSGVGIIIRAMSALFAEGYWHYHPSDVSTTTRIMSLLSCAMYLRPWSCMSKTIEAMFLVQSDYYYGGVGITIRTMSALSAEGYQHYHPSNVSNTTRMMPLLSCIKYSRPLSCMSRTIRAMLVQCHHFQSGVNIIIRAMSSPLLGRCQA